MLVKNFDLQQLLAPLDPNICIFVTLGKDDNPYCVSIEHMREDQHPTDASSRVILVRAFEIQGGRSAMQLDDPEWYLRESDDEHGLVGEVLESLKQMPLDAEVMIELGPDKKPYQVKLERVSEFEDVSLEDEDAEYEDCISIELRAYEIPSKFVQTIVEEKSSEALAEKKRREPTADSTELDSTSP